MSQDYKDRRRFPRAIFSVSDGIIGRFSVPNIPGLNTAYILNMSEDGLFFSVRRDLKSIIKKESILHFIEVKKWGKIKFLVNIRVKVIWISEHPEIDNVGVGCRYMELSATSRESIKKLVEVKLFQGVETV